MMDSHKDKTIYVYDSFSDDEPLYMGCLFSEVIRGEETFSFCYDRSWLLAHDGMELDPFLHGYEGRQYLPLDKKQFGVFADSSPDRWGRTLLKRNEAIVAKKENRPAVTLLESDFLLGVNDATRIGGLRFKTDKDGPFLSTSDGSVPPMIRLRELENASIGFENDDELSTNLELLLSPGSSLGGARPKANVVDENGNLWIAKFPSKNDEEDVGAWEYVAHELAVLCGLKTPEAKLCKFSNYGSTYISKRFDRDADKRIHFASAMTILGKEDGESNECSYLDLLEFLLSFGAMPKEDAKELWRRIVFNIAIKNTDDHLRNHGFIWSRKGWILSPAYDINPNPDGSCLSLNIMENSSLLDFNLALDTSFYYGVSRADGEKYIATVVSVVEKNLSIIAKKAGIGDRSIERMCQILTERR